LITTKDANKTPVHKEIKRTVPETISEPFEGITDYETGVDYQLGLDYQIGTDYQMSCGSIKCNCKSRRRKRQANNCCQCGSQYHGLQELVTSASRGSDSSQSKSHGSSSDQSDSSSDSESSDSSDSGSSETEAEAVPGEEQEPPPDEESDSQESEEEKSKSGRNRKSNEIVDKYSSDLSRNSYAQIPQLVDRKNRGLNKGSKGSLSKEAENIKSTQKRRRHNPSEKDEKYRGEEHLERKSNEKKKKDKRSDGKSSEEEHE